jgi:hypothetical protein
MDCGMSSAMTSRYQAIALRAIPLIRRCFATTPSPALL